MQAVVTFIESKPDRYHDPYGSGVGVGFDVDEEGPLRITTNMAPSGDYELRGGKNPAFISDSGRIDLVAASETYFRFKEYGDQFARRM